MSAPQLLAVSTASHQDPVWKTVTRNVFRTNVVDLQRASAKCPADPGVHSRAPRLGNDDDLHVIPFEVEQRLADDFAFLAAFNKDVWTITAVALEEVSQPRGLVVRLAANAAIDPLVLETLNQILRLLRQCSKRRMYMKYTMAYLGIIMTLSGLALALCEDQILDHVMRLNRNRIHGRLESKRWQIPAYFHIRTGGYKRQPLYREMEKYMGHLTRCGVFADLKHDLADLCAWYQRADTIKTNGIEELQVLKQITQRSHAFSTLARSLLRQEDTFGGLNARNILESKHFLQVEKLGRYWGLCEDMAKASCKYRDIFRNVRSNSLDPYESIKSAISYSGNIVECFVHAEMQLLVHYGLYLDPNIVQPRVFGVSKAACYLCKHFIFYHEQFFLTKTHGKLYDEWNIPDLSQYNEIERSKYRRVLSQISDEIQRILPQERLRHHKRKWPLESWTHLPDIFLTSPPSSNAGNSLPDASGSVTSVATSGTMTPRAPNRTTTPRLTSPMMGLSSLSNFASLPENPNSPRPLASRSSLAATQQYHTGSSHVMEERESASTLTPGVGTPAFITPSDPGTPILRAEPDQREAHALHQEPPSKPSQSEKAVPANANSHAHSGVPMILYDALDVSHLSLDTSR